MPPFGGVRFGYAEPEHVYDLAPCPEVRVGDFVVAETPQGLLVGQVVWKRPQVDGEAEAPIPQVLRLASSRDLVLQELARTRAQETLEMLRTLAAKHELGAVVFAHVTLSLDQHLVTVEYYPEGEVDARRWAAFTRKVEKRLAPREVVWKRIGPRDMAKRVGGWGPCGRIRCCALFMTDFNSIQIRMAKAQNVSLSGTDITGACGRLRCCLAFEYPVYQEMLAQLPKVKSRVLTPKGEGKVVEVQPLQNLVRVEFPDGSRYLFPKDEILPPPCEDCPLRSAAAAENGENLAPEADAEDAEI